MPVHDWTRVSPGTFHDFHTRWITHLTEALNEGLLPPGYYALAEQSAPHIRPDVITLSTLPRQSAPEDSGSVATIPRPATRVSRKADPNFQYRTSRRTIVIRHTSAQSDGGDD